MGIIIFIPNVHNLLFPMAIFMNWSWVSAQISTNYQNNITCQIMVADIIWCEKNMDNFQINSGNSPNPLGFQHGRALQKCTKRGAAHVGLGHRCAPGLSARRFFLGDPFFWWEKNAYIVGYCWIFTISITFQVSKLDLHCIFPTRWCPPQLCLLVNPHEYYTCIPLINPRFIGVIGTKLAKD